MSQPLLLTVLSLVAQVLIQAALNIVVPARSDSWVVAAASP